MSWHVRSVAAAGFALLLAACTGRPAPVERVLVTHESLPLSGYPKLPGRYAAQIQNGGWDLTIVAAGSSCGNARVTADINAVWVQSMRDALAHVLENVEFLDDAPTPERLRARGVNTGIVIYQGNVASGFRVDSYNPLDVARGEVRLTAVLGLLGSGGVIAQHTVESAAGAATRASRGCDRVAETMTLAAQHAAGSIARDIARQVREALARPAVRTDPTPAPAPRPIR